jgi:hypothetical protein
MKLLSIPTLLIAALVLTLSCARQTLNSQSLNNANCHIDPLRDDTTQIIHALLSHTITTREVSDYNLIKDKKRIYVVNTFFKPFNSIQDISTFHGFENVVSLPNKIRGTQFFLKSYEDLQSLANEQEDHFTALQIGFITIDADTAITGIRTVPLRSKKLSAKRVMLAGGGHYCKFQKVNGKWVYIGTVFGSWIS